MPSLNTVLVVANFKLWHHPLVDGSAHWAVSVYRTFCLTNLRTVLHSFRLWKTVYICYVTTISFCVFEKSHVNRSINTSCSFFFYFIVFCSIIIIEFRIRSKRLNLQCVIILTRSRIPTQFSESHSYEIAFMFRKYDDGFVVTVFLVRRRDILIDTKSRKKISSYCFRGYPLHRRRDVK